MNSLEKPPHALDRCLALHFARAVIKLPKIGPRAKSTTQLAIKNHRMRFISHALNRCRKSLQIFKRGRSNLIAGIAMKRHLDNSVFQLPRKRLSLKRFHPFSSFSVRRVLEVRDFMACGSLRSPDFTGKDTAFSPAESRI